jgi:hypothetical protein
MDRSTGVTQQAEKPGRLQLAIVEWQWQLIAKRDPRIERLIHSASSTRNGVTV